MSESNLYRSIAKSVVGFFIGDAGREPARDADAVEGAIVNAQDDAAPVSPEPPAAILAEVMAAAEHINPERSAHIMSIESKLGECMDIDGAIAVALVDGSSGMAIATGGTPRNLDLNIAAAGTCNVLKSEQSTMKELGYEDEIEDILITLSSQYHLIRPLTDASGKGLFVYLVLDKAKGNLAMARFKLGRIEKDLTI